MAHYDLGNAFYRLWLDPSMSYSAAIYRDVTTARWKPPSTPSTAHPALPAGRQGRACWRSAAAGAALPNWPPAGLQVTGLTLSPAQLAWAQQRVPAADLRLQDYRDNKEQFDHVVSIEMFEAVGERWWPSYFKTVAGAEAGGRAVQSITIRDDLFAATARAPTSSSNTSSPAACCRRAPPSARRRPPGPGRAQRIRLRPRLRPHPGRMARRLRSPLAGNPETRLRRNLPPPVAHVSATARPASAPEASMSSSLNSRIVDLVAPGARQMAVASERRRALLLALAGLPFAAWGSRIRRPA
jgi:hypothetical protein